MKKIAFLAFFVFCIFVSAGFAQEFQNFNLVGQYFNGSPLGPVLGVCTDGVNLYVSQGLDTLRIFNIATIASPSDEIGGCSAPHVDLISKSGHLILGSGDYDWAGITLFDASDPANPIRINYNSLWGDIITHPRIKGNILYAPLFDDFRAQGLLSLDISDPYHPVYLNQRTIDGLMGYDVAFYGNTAYVSNLLSGGFSANTYIFDISDPHNLIPIRDIPYGYGAAEVYGKYLFLGGHVQYDSGPINVYSLQDPQNPSFVLSLPVANTGSSAIEFVNGLMFIVTIQPSLKVIDIGGFDYPESLACFDLPSAPWVPQDIAVNGNTVYFTAGDSGLYVLNYTGPMPINTGDANNSGTANGIDVIYLSNYLKYGGNPPVGPRERGDTNGDCVVNGLDIVYLVNYLKGGPSPIRGFCYGL